MQFNGMMSGPISTARLALHGNLAQANFADPRMRPAATHALHSHVLASFRNTMRGSSICGRDGDYIVRRQGPPDPLQLELADRLDLHGVLDLRQHPRTNQDLPRLRFIA